jgi:hypothetical protein
MSSNEARHPGRIDFNNTPNDYVNNGHTHLSDPNFRWNGTTGIKSKPLSNQQLAALRDAAISKGCPLNDKERAAILAS